MPIARLLELTAILSLAVCLPISAQLPDSTHSVDTHITVNGRDRHFLVDLPPRDASRGPMPVVLVFHGGAGSPERVRTKTSFTATAGAAGAIVVYPAGSGRMGDDRILTWNVGTCCGYAQRQNIDDVAFVRAMLDKLEATYHVDTQRVFATGFSNGAMMTYLVGCRLGDRIAAIAVVSGELTEPCNPSRPISVLIIHGTADENLPYNGGVGQNAVDKHDVRPVSYAVDSWRSADRCTGAPIVTKSGAVTHSVWRNCADKSAVQLYVIDGGGHAWPGGPKTTPNSPSGALNATRVVWSFFQSVLAK